MPAPSLLIVCLPNQTKVAPHPVHPARGSRQGAWPSRHGDQEQWPVPDSAWTQHPNPALLPWQFPLLPLSPPLPLGWLWQEVGAQNHVTHTKALEGKERLWVLEEDQRGLVKTEVQV